MRDANVHLFIRVHRSVINADFIVQVGAGGAAGQANESDELATADAITRADGKTGEMSVAGADAVAMLDLNQPPVTTHGFSFGDNAVSGRNDGMAVIR